MSVENGADGLKAAGEVAPAGSDSEDEWPEENCTGRDADYVDDEDDEHLLTAVNSFVQERLNLRPPKRNNVKKKYDPVSAASVASCAVLPPEAAGVACPHCGAVDSFHADGHRAEFACGRCGHVATVGPELAAVGGNDGSRPVVDARVNYFRERLSQWCNREPPIPPSGVRKLLEAYDRCRHDGGPFRVSSLLTKPEVRALVIEAGLRPKNCVEKWLTIRSILLRHAGLTDDRVQPTQQEVSECMNRFSTFLAAWDEHPELHDGRTSLPNYNFLMVSFILQISADSYERHAMWFPQVTGAKRERLQRTFDLLCDIIGWPRYRAEVDECGKVHRVRQATLKTK